MTDANHPDAEAAVKIVSDMTGYSRDRMFDGTRRMEVVIQRWMVWCVLFYFYKWSYSRIGRAFGYDHATIMSGLKKLSDLYDSDKLYRAKITSILRRAAKNFYSEEESQ